MTTLGKRRYKPFYKQFLRLRKNVQNRFKLFNFKKQKWKRFQSYSQRQLGFFKRFKIQDQYGLVVNKFASSGNSFQRKFRNNLIERKVFSLFYGQLSKKYLKRQITNAKVKSDKGFANFRHETLKVFESRLDTVLYRASFSLSIKTARQMIKHGHVLVNGCIVRTKTYLLKTDDVVEIAHNKKSRELVRKNITRSNFWPLPPKHLLINYNTFQIVFVYGKSSNFSPVMNHYLNLDSVIGNIKNF